MIIIRSFSAGFFKTFLVFFISATLITNMVIKIERYFYGVKPGVTLEGLPMDGFLEREVQKMVKALAIERDIPPRAATLMPLTGEIYPERVGQQIQVEATVQKIMKAQKDTPVYLKTKILLPKFTASDLAEITEQIGYYQTTLTGSPQRVHNIQLAAKSINYILLKPGEIFSFNRIVGPRSEKRGFLPAPIISSDGHDLGFGGGVCQAASTLYNAALKANLKILERHRHTKKVSYVPPGKDATVTYPYLDLKFQNSLETPIIIKSSFGGGRVAFWIIGKV